MKTFAVTAPEIAIVAATRGIAGAGIGLLAAEFLRPDIRRTLGWTLLTVGALTTIPIAMALFGKHPIHGARHVGWQCPQRDNDRAPTDARVGGSL